MNQNRSIYKSNTFWWWQACCTIWKSETLKLRGNIGINKMKMSFDVWIRNKKMQRIKWMLNQRPSAINHPHSEMIDSKLRRRERCRRSSFIVSHDTSIISPIPNRPFFNFTSSIKSSRASQLENLKTKHPPELSFI